MTEDEDWQIDNNEGTRNSRKVLIMVLVAVLIVASVSSFLILLGDDKEDDLPSKAQVPSLQVGMDWWYHREHRTIVYDTGINETYDWNYYQRMVRNISTINGKSAYGISSIYVNNTSTRHSNSLEYYLSIDDLNPINEQGEEFVTFDFPLFDGKRWNWTDEDDNNITYVCNTYKNVKTTAGTYHTYRVRMTWSIEDGDEREEYTHDYYYSPKLKYLARGEYRMDFYSDDALRWSGIDYLDFVIRGTSDADNDGLSNTGESWFGTDPAEKDTDSDGFDDLADHVPLFDLGLSVNLTHVSTDENVESIEEVTLFGEEDGADFYFDLSNDDNDDVLVTDPIENTDNTDLDIFYQIDISDDTFLVDIEVMCLDADDGNADDDMDISLADPEHVLILEFNTYSRRLHIPHIPAPEGELELDVEEEMYGNGNGDYDATLRFIVSEVDMKLEE